MVRGLITFLAALLSGCIAVGDEPVIHSLTSLPTQVELGRPATLSWVVTGASRLTIEPGHYDVTGASTATVYPTTTTTYTLVATNRHGSTRSSVRVLVYQQEGNDAANSDTR